MAATKYTYSISGDFPNEKVDDDKLQIQIGDSAIATAISYIITHGDDCDIWFADALSSGDETILDGLVAAHDGEPIPMESNDVKNFLDSNAKVTDPDTDLFGPFLVMQVLTNRRELFNDVENPIYDSSITPLLGSGGSVTNLNNIHGKLGWHNQEVQQAMWQRPTDLLIYYGYPNSFNSAVNSWNNEKVAQDMAKYGIVVLGNGVANPSHPDYSNTEVIVPRIKALNPGCKIFGYVTVNQSTGDFEDEVDEWEVLEVDGIFMDEAGYDYGSVATNGRVAFNTKVDYVHDQTYAKLCFVNAWNMDHIIGTANDPSYPNSTWNSGAVASDLTANDWYLLESYPINTTAYTASTPDGYEPKADWASRGVKAQGHRATYGINLAGSGIINNSNVDGQGLFDFLFVSAMIFSLDAVGSSDTSYGASSAAVDWWTRPDVSKMGPLYSLNASVQVDVGDSDVYGRYVDFGRFALDFSDSAQAAAVTKW